MDARFPSVSRVEWLRARDVIGGEARDFTPWLAEPENLVILGEALLLEELTPIATEHDVSGRRLDILATAIDESGTEIDVCIENQYGITDADHLGRLITYLAQRERGRAVWVVEDAHDAYIAAVSFLNRTSVDDVGYYLVRVRFTHGPAGGYQVFFDVVVGPNTWERPSRRARTATSIERSRVGHDWAEQVRMVLEPLVRSRGVPRVSLGARPVIRIGWPAALADSMRGLRLLIRVTRQNTVVSIVTRAFGSAQANRAAIDSLQTRYGDALEQALANRFRLEWNQGGGVSGTARIVIDGIGYPDGDPATAATAADEIIGTWIRSLEADPPSDLSMHVDAIVDAPDDSVDEEDDVV